MEFGLLYYKPHQNFIVLVVQISVEKLMKNNSHIYLFTRGQDVKPVFFNPFYLTVN